jgi:hypothetical protein
MKSRMPVFLPSLVALSVLVCASVLGAQAPVVAPRPPVQTGAIAVAPAPVAAAGPIAIVPLDSKSADSAAMVTGALQVSGGKAIIAASGAVTSGAATTEVTLPHRGVLRVCASTTVKLAADSSVPAGEVPGLMMVLNHGAVEADFATGRNSDILLTPDFRILIGGPGAANVKVRLGQHGDTCVDNAGINAPYVLVTSVFDGSVYRVQPGQRVMFQHGSLLEVVDQEKEPCGCPAATRPGTNDFPLAQSAGLAPLPPPGPAGVAAPGTGAGGADTFVYKSGEKQAEPDTASDAPATPTPTTRPAHKHRSAVGKPTLLTRIGHFFRRLFGAE